MSWTMPGDEVKVTALTDGSEEAAVLLKCADCGYDRFLALLIGPTRDLHLQCVRCGLSHCAHDSGCRQARKVG